MEPKTHSRLVSSSKHLQSKKRHGQQSAGSLWAGVVHAVIVSDPVRREQYPTCLPTPQDDPRESGRRFRGLAIRRYMTTPSMP